MLFGIQYLRAIAALSVVAFHAANTPAGSFFYIGQAGVDVFFVISGFIMWSISQREDAAAFARNRIARVVPLYWLVTLVIFIGSRIAPSLFPTLYGTWQRVSDLVLSMTFVPHPDMHGERFPVVLQGWTLNYEMAFYAVMCATLLLPTRLRMPAVLAGVVALSVPAGSIVLEFAAGVVIAALPRAGLRLSCALAASALVVFATEAMTGVEAPWRVVAWGLPAAAVVTGVIGAEPSIPRLAFLRRLGDASYSIYLIHLPVVAVVVLLPIPLVPRLALSLACAAAIGLAMRPLERGLQRWALRTIDWRPPVGAPAVSGR